MDPGTHGEPDACKRKKNGELTISDVRLTAWQEREGALLRLRLARPKANLIDIAMVEAIETALEARRHDGQLHAVLLDHEGPNFSYGASIPEHMPDEVWGMLKGMHRLLLGMLEHPVPILVSARGYCLGGGLELAASAHLLFVSPDAKLGQPEAKLGVFAPAASCLLPERIGQARANDLLLSGRMIDALEAVSIGLANQRADDPEVAALRYYDDYLAPLSASSLRYAVRAARTGFTERINDQFTRIESLYLDELMTTSDAVEGLEAFMEKRSPVWQKR